jgi:hypothetical protein
VVQVAMQQNGFAGAGDQLVEQAKGAGDQLSGQ